MSTPREEYPAGSIMAQSIIRFTGTRTLKVFPIQHELISQRFIDLDYDPLLINCFEGLLETDHPYSFVANRALTELL